MMYKIEFPTTHTTNRKRLAWCYKAKAMLIEEHNAKGRAFKNKDINQSEWDNYKKEQFSPRFSATLEPILFGLDHIERFMPTWSPSIETNLNTVDGEVVVVYPNELDQSDDGDVLSFLATFSEVLQQNGFDNNSPEVIAVANENANTVNRAINSSVHVVDLDAHIIER